MTFGEWFCNSFVPFFLAVLPAALWMLFWLFAVNWKKLWPWLATGAWAPVVLLLLIIGFVWSRVAPGECNCLGFITVPNLWWQLGNVGLFAGLALFSGWLQEQIGYTPPEVSLDPPVHGHAHDEGHGHSHEQHHEHGHGGGHH